MDFNLYDDGISNKFIVLWHLIPIDAILWLNKKQKEIIFKDEKICLYYLWLRS